MTMSDQYLRALANEQRRDLLAELQGTGAQNSLNVRTNEAIDEALMMYHVHLPLLEEAGLILWDKEQDLVSRGERFDEVTLLLNDVQEQTPVTSD